MSLHVINSSTYPPPPPPPILPLLSLPFHQLSLQSHMSKLGEDYKLLSRLSCPYIISPTGINVSPPVLGMDLSPFGSLREYMAKGSSLLQSDIHQIGLQVGGQ